MVQKMAVSFRYMDTIGSYALNVNKYIINI